MYDEDLDGSLSAALAFIRNATMDPVRSRENASAALPHLARLEAALRGKPNTERWITPTRVVQVTVPSTGQTTPTADVPVRFPRRGLITHVMASVLEGSEHLGKVSVAMRTGAGDPIVTDGQGETYLPLEHLIGSKSPIDYAARFRMQVDQMTVFTVRFASSLPNGHGGGGNLVLTPFLSFAFEPMGT